MGEFRTLFCYRLNFEFVNSDTDYINNDQRYYFCSKLHPRITNLIKCRRANINVFHHVLSKYKEKTFKLQALNYYINFVYKLSFVDFEVVYSFQIYNIALKIDWKCYINISGPVNYHMSAVYSKYQWFDHLCIVFSLHERIRGRKGEWNKTICE